MFRKLLDQGQAGDNVGACCCAAPSVKTSSVAGAGKPGSITPHTQVHRRGLCAESKEEGGRHTPFFNNYRPQFYFRTTDDRFDRAAGGHEMVMPGDNVSMTVKLIARSPWKKACASRSAKVVAPSAQRRRQDHRVIARLLPDRRTCSGALQCPQQV